MNEAILGIDLGTTYSTAAVVIDSKLHYALDARGESCIPSVVHFPKAGPPIVGADAERFRATDPANTITGIKRVIGRTIDSPAARLLDAGAAFRIKGTGPSEVSVLTRQGELTASQVAATIVAHLKERAEHRFARKFTKCIMTMPVVAPPQLPQHMLRIGRMAGLEVIRVLHEPIGGAVARGLVGALGDETPRLVFDFGGGTLDVTVVQRNGGCVDVRSVAGDECLGGNDFDAAFARHVANVIWGTASVDVTKDVLLFDRIQRQCELVKRALSHAPEARFHIPEAIGVPGHKRTLDTIVRREHLTQTWSELVARSVTVACEAVVAAGIKPAALGNVMMIGGTTFVPQVREAVAHTLRVPLDLEKDPQTAVARGAALLAVFPDMLIERKAA